MNKTQNSNRVVSILRLLEFGIGLGFGPAFGGIGVWDF
jgi:hypothetical protein